MRIFVALDLSDDLIDALSRLQDHLKTGRLVPEDDLHLTLAFVPDIKPQPLDDLALDLEMLRTAPLALDARGVATFGSARPRSLRAAIMPNPALNYLQSKVTTLIRRAGVILPHRRFVPHITLARFPNTMAPDEHARLGRFLQAHGDWSHPPTPATKLTLYQSTLTPDGPRYDALQSHDLI
ncbi:RNA 2',3'-cyclic phosphodiesterase [Maribius pontilimi]|uniref:RNA 2',3'-cyclic phosphodiesterase n=1 Tax=Palleronia pontilimi TaxID=1964209 RepID=A0A934IGT0_9RHOB|nr:RNA 2',3'-cyclic phosphodiesterase [Palleronia pontilimi]MBJ3762305.1 RNA 2',3'-cyclic phosphodiesterase [Palleronia pontilimi]